MKAERLLTIASLAATAFLVTGAFNYKTRKEIKERSMGRSELSGRYDRPMHCSHIDHCFQNKSSKKYNSPKNGMYITDIEHLAYHMHWDQNPNYIGMTKSGNQEAIRLLSQRIGNYDRENGISEEQTNQDFKEAMYEWQVFYDEKQSALEA